jgi:hypothetical protein
LRRGEKMEKEELGKNLNCGREVSMDACEFRDSEVRLRREGWGNVEWDLLLATLSDFFLGLNVKVL